MKTNDELKALGFTPVSEGLPTAVPHAFAYLVLMNDAILTGPHPLYGLAELCGPDDSLDAKYRSGAFFVVGGEHYEITHWKELESLK